MIRISQKQIPKWMLIKLPELTWTQQAVVGKCDDPMCAQRGCYQKIMEHQKVEYPCTRMWNDQIKPEPLWAYKLDRLSIWIQKNLQKINIHIHNPLREECCIDFMCCSKEWHGTEYEHLLLSLSDAAKNNQSIVKIKTMKNQN